MTQTARDKWLTIMKINDFDKNVQLHLATDQFHILFFLMRHNWDGNTVWINGKYVENSLVQ